MNPLQPKDNLIDESAHHKSLSSSSLFNHIRYHTEMFGRVYITGDDQKWDFFNHPLKKRKKTNEKKEETHFFFKFLPTRSWYMIMCFWLHFFFFLFFFSILKLFWLLYYKLFVRVFSIGRWGMRWEEVLRCIPVCTLCMMSGLLSHAGACSRRHHHRLEQLLRRLLPGPPPCHQHLSSIIFRLEMWWGRPYRHSA